VAIRRFIILAATCVFAKQSLGPILCGQLQLKGACPSHLPPAPLIPKLRGHFAEFLFHGSLEHLRLLASPTCVGLRYGRTSYSRTRLFLAASSQALGWKSIQRSASGLSFKEADLPTSPDYTVASGRPFTRRLARFRVPPCSQTQLARHANIHAFPIVYGSRPRLRGRLTRSG
jgi:hypothetical protein